MSKIIVRAIRVPGVLLGWMSVAYGASILFAALPHTRDGGAAIGMGFVLVGVLLTLPWGRISSRFTFLALTALLVLALAPLASLLAIGYVWADVHGALEWWENTIVFASALVLLAQFPAIYLMYRQTHAKLLESSEHRRA